jgi:hypothetical protein
MNKTSRPLLAALAVVLVIVALAMGLAVTHESGGIDGNLIFFDHDLSDSAFGWAIAIPILVLVAIIVAAICAGAALLTVVAVMFAAFLALLAMLLAMTPIAIFLAIPVLAVYGLVKLFQRNAVRTA